MQNDNPGLMLAAGCFLIIIAAIGLAICWTIFALMFGPAAATIITVVIAAIAILRKSPQNRS